MEKYIKVLSLSEIMKGIDGNEIVFVLECLNAYKKNYKKNAIIYGEADIANFLGIVLSGEVSVVKIDFYGNKNIILKLGAGGVFAETAALSSEKRLPFSIEAESDCEILCIDAAALTKTCCKNCRFHRQLLDNCFTAIANRNITLTRKISILSMRTTRERVLEFLNIRKKISGSNTVIIDMTRQEMANYLSVDRSALSRELSALKKNKVIDFYKNTFKLL